MEHVTSMYAISYNVKESPISRHFYVSKLGMNIAFNLISLSFLGHNFTFIKELFVGSMGHI